MKRLEKEIRDLRDEEGMENLLHLCYDHLADGGRNLKIRIAHKKVNPETAAAIRRIWA